MREYISCFYFCSILLKNHNILTQSNLIFIKYIHYTCFEKDNNLHFIICKIYIYIFLFLFFHFRVLLSWRSFLRSFFLLVFWLSSLWFWFWLINSLIMGLIIILVNFIYHKTYINKSFMFCMDVFSWDWRILHSVSLADLIICLWDPLFSLVYSIKNSLSLFRSDVIKSRILNKVLIFYYLNY